MSEYHWTQAEINDTDQDLLDELLEYLAARGQIEKEEAEKREKELKALKAKRR